MAGDCKEQVVWITGGGSGIGKALAREFVARGAKVAVSGRRLENLQQVAKELGGEDNPVLPVVCDVTDPEAVKSAVEEVVDTTGSRHGCSQLVHADQTRNDEEPWEKEETRAQRSSFSDRIRIEQAQFFLESLLLLRRHQFCPPSTLLLDPGSVP